MIAFRIAASRHPVWSSEGARRFGARWNSPGRPVIYAGAGFAIALLERLVYTAIGRLRAGDRFVRIDVPDALVESLDETALPGWEAPDSRTARVFGDRWLEEARSPALLVPSVVTRIDRNLVVNPAHPDAARVAVGDEQRVAWDPRLLARLG